MIGVLGFALAMLVPMIAWNMSVFFVTSEGRLKSPIVKSDSSKASAVAVEETVTEEYTGNFGMILIENVEMAERYFMSSARASSCPPPRATRSSLVIVACGTLLIRSQTD